MGIRNEMEQLVRQEVSRAKAEGGTGYEGCWCPLCEIDIIALTLTLLPPLYCRSDSQGNTSKLIRSGTICDAVQSALKRVTHSPKHRPGTQPSVRNDIGLINYTFEVGSSMIGPALGRVGGGCDCDECRADALAYALNRYPAKYGISQRGQRSLHATYIDFMRYELGMLITQAARVVSTHPRHDGG